MSVQAKTKWVNLLLRGLAEDISRDPKEIRNTKTMDEEFFDLYGPHRNPKQGELLGERFPLTPGSAAVARFTATRNSFQEAMRYSLSLPPLRVVKRIQEALVLAGEPFEPIGWDAWTPFSRSGLAELGIHTDQTMWNLCNRLTWDDGKTVAKVLEAFNEARPYARRLLILRARLISYDIVNHDYKEKSVRSIKAPQEVESPYLGVRLDLENRTVSRDGYDSVPPIELPNKQWQLMRIFLDGRGGPVNVSESNYNGSTHGSAVRNVRDELDTNLLPLDLTTKGFQLRSVR